MKYNNSNLLMLALLAGAVPTAHGASGVTGGHIHFTGSLVDTACTVSTGSANQRVSLGQHSARTFKKAGDASGLTPFTIRLGSCNTATLSTVAVAFSGAVDAGNANLLAVDAVGGNDAATRGIGIQILDRASHHLRPNGSAYSSVYPLTDGDNLLRFNTRYVATSAAPAVGQANADATFLMQYE